MAFSGQRLNELSASPTPAFSVYPPGRPPPPPPHTHTHKHPHIHTRTHTYTHTASCGLGHQAALWRNIFSEVSIKVIQLQRGRLWFSRFHGNWLGQERSDVQQNTSSVSSPLPPLFSILYSLSLSLSLPILSLSPSLISHLPALVCLTHLLPDSSRAGPLVSLTKATTTVDLGSTLSWL